MTKTAVVLTLILGLVQSIQAQAPDGDSTRQLAVEIAYRLDRELGAVDAAQKHLLVWRLLTAQADGEVPLGEPISDRWLEWQQTIEQLERRLDLNRLPVWHWPARPDEVTALLAAEVPEPGPLQWLPPIDSPELAAAGVRLVTNRNAVLQASSQYPVMLAWARSHAAQIWLGLLAELVVPEPELVRIGLLVEVAPEQREVQLSQPAVVKLREFFPVLQVRRRPGRSRRPGRRYHPPESARFLLEVSLPRRSPTWRHESRLEPRALRDADSKIQPRSGRSSLHVQVGSEPRPFDSGSRT